MKKSPSASLAMLSLCVLLAAPASAQMNLLKEGEELLKGVTGDSGEETIAGLSAEEIGNGLKEALRVGSERVVEQVGAVNGFNGDEAIHLPLPESMQSVQKALSAVGMSDLLDDLELKLNRAAEAAAPETKAVFWQAIDEMTLEDIKEIYEGPEDAATRYFQSKMSPALAERMRPVIDDSLSDVGAIKAYEAVMGEYESLPFVPDVKTDLGDYVVEKGMDGIFHYLAKEEAAIRQNPVKRSTELLQKVFGAT